MFDIPYKIVEKEYGKEIWLILNDKFCFKHIFINKGHRCSLQYHNFKSEAMYILSGKALFTIMENDELKEYELKSGSIVDVPATTIHRMEALEDLELVECSTPEVDDIVRLLDDYNRK